jgi:hypothetical protein
MVKRGMAIQWLTNQTVKKQELLIEDIEAASQIEKTNIMMAYQMGVKSAIEALKKIEDWNSPTSEPNDVIQCMIDSAYYFENHYE